MKKRTLMQDIAELDRLNKELDRIQNDPEYIAKKAKEVFGDTSDITSSLTKAIDQLFA